MNCKGYEGRDEEYIVQHLFSVLTINSKKGVRGCYRSTCISCVSVVLLPAVMMQVNLFYPLQHFLSTSSMHACVTLTVTCISWHAEVTEGAQQCACGWAATFQACPSTHTQQKETEFTSDCTFL